MQVRIEAALTRHRANASDAVICIEAGSPALRLIEICADLRPDIAVMCVHHDGRLVARVCRIDNRQGDRSGPRAGPGREAPPHRKLRPRPFRDGWRGRRIRRLRLRGRLAAGRPAAPGPGRPDRTATRRGDVAYRHRSGGAYPPGRADPERPGRFARACRHGCAARHDARAARPAGKDAGPRDAPPET